jgi:TonB family protein
MAHALTLGIYRDGALVERRTLDQEMIKIGRLPTSTVRLDDDGVARMHAVIETTGAELRVVDLGASAGVMLNGAKVDRNAALRVGDVLGVGAWDIAIEAAASTATALRPAAIPSASTDLPRPAVEVVARYRDHVIDVRHLGQIQARSGRASAMIGAGAFMVLAGAALFARDVAQDWDAHGEAAAAAREAGRPLPADPGTGLGGLGMLIALAGLIPLVGGTLRSRDRDERRYTIGEGEDATLAAPTDGLPDSAAFPLVVGAPESPVVMFTRSMAGEATIDGRATSLAELASSGRAVAQGDTFALPLPDGASCRVDHGALSFSIRQVAAARAPARRGAADRPFWIANAATLSVVGSLTVLAHMVPEDALAMGLEEQIAENRFVGYMSQPDLAEDEPQPTEDTDDQAQGGSPGQRHAGDEGKMGDPRERAANKRYASKGPKTAIPQLARTFDPDLVARNAGILGMMQQESGHFLASPYGEAFAVGNDDEDVWGNMTGTEIGAAYGVGGMGLVGSGRGGGGTAEGLIGLGQVGTIGLHGSGGRCTNPPCGYGPGDGVGTGFDDRKRRVPKARIAGQPKVQGQIDKEIIRRIVRAHINEVRYCYNQGLVRDPNLSGRVAVQFTIGPTGSVLASVVAESSLGDANVDRCVAKAVKRWAFPKPSAGGHVIVTYPFALEPG